MFTNLWATLTDIGRRCLCDVDQTSLKPGMWRTSCSNKASSGRTMWIGRMLAESTPPTSHSQTVLSVCVRTRRRRPHMFDLAFASSRRTPESHTCRRSVGHLPLFGDSGVLPVRRRHSPRTAQTHNWAASRKSPVGPVGWVGQRRCCRRPRMGQGACRERAATA